MSHEWKRVSRQNPCPICRKPDWCTIAADGSAACCMRISSDTRMGNGGYLHQLGRDLFGTPVRASQKPPTAHLPPDKIAALWADWAIDTGQYRIAALAANLGVSGEALRAIGAGWAWPYDAWAFPMFDGSGEFTGLRLRSESGEKWALTGSRQGIFLPEAQPDSNEALVCEGPTDLAAILSLGFWGIGRPSCTGGATEIAVFCRRHGIGKLTILADNDGPGRDGAERLAAESHLRARIITLPAKDVREAVRLGASRTTVETCIKNATWRR